MKLDSKLSSILHLLLHMAHSERPMTSEALAACLQGSPVVVRRTLAGLREAGFVSSEKGHGGGWVLACNLKTVTLRDVYDAVARMLGTNPVVVRKTLAGLRDAGFVVSGRGHGGGWAIAVDLRRVTLRDVYEAVGAPTVFAMGHRSDNPECLVEQAVNGALSGALQDAQALLVQRLGRVTLADLAADFNRRFAAHPHARSHLEHIHLRHHPE